MFNSKRLSGWMALAVFATVGGAMVAADPAFAKVDVDKLTIGGEIRVRYEYRVGGTFGTPALLGALPAGTTGGQANESGASERVRISVGYELTPDVSFFAQIQDARNFGNEGCAFTPPGAAVAGGCVGSGIGAVSSANNNGTGVDLHQGYIQVKNVLVPGLALKIGRQEIIYGDHRLFGNFGWSQIGNSFDAAKIMWNSDMVDVDLIWARIIDSANNTGGAASGLGSSTGVVFPAATTRGTLNQDIYGAYITLKPTKGWTIEPYFFLLQDTRDQAVVVAGGGTAACVTLCAPQTRAQTRHTTGARINGKAGGLDFTYEGVSQFGSIASAANGGGAAVTNSRDLHINAHAHAVKTGFTFEAVPMKPRLGFEFDYASGDPCANKFEVNGTTNNGQSCQGQRHLNTFDNLFPTNHFHYGYMDVMAWRNMVNYQIMFDVKPSAVSKLQFNYIIHRLARASDNWYRAGQVAYGTSCGGFGSAAGCFGHTNQAASLGQELDVHYWHTFKEKFKFDIGYGHFWAGEYLDKAVPANISTGPTSTASFAGNSGQNWGYVMASVIF